MPSLLPRMRRSSSVTTFNPNEEESTPNTSSAVGKVFQRGGSLASSIRSSLRKMGQVTSKLCFHRLMSHFAVVFFFLVKVTSSNYCTSLCVHIFSLHISFKPDVYAHQSSLTGILTWNIKGQHLFSQIVDCYNKHYVTPQNKFYFIDT